MRFIPFHSFMGFTFVFLKLNNSLRCIIFLPEHDTGPGLRDLAFQQALVVLVVEELDIPGTAVVQAVFYGYIINKGFILLYRTSGTTLYPPTTIRKRLFQKRLANWKL